MFTGIIQSVGTVASSQPSAAGVRLLVDPGPWPYRPQEGDSIAVNGCCLTVAAPPQGSQWAFDAVPETLTKTTLGGFASGTKVNLEHAALASTLMGGHIVQGHVDGVGDVVSIETSPEYRVRIRPPADLMQFLAPKGSICVDGVSLTVAALNAEAGWFEVALIPTTLEKTTLGSLRPGGRCNIEADMIAKTVVNWLKHYGGRPNA